MAVTINIKTCIGCENCTAICPTGAMYMENGKAAVIAETCIECGACITDCSAESITLLKEEMINDEY